MGCKLSMRSKLRLKKVHHDLARVVKRCASDWPEGSRFVITEGMRSLKRQQKLVAAGASQTMNSRHLSGHAVDLAVVVGGQARWDWPLYHTLGKRMKEAAAEEEVALEWGGDWRTLKDGPHFQLPRKPYPVLG